MLRQLLFGNLVLAVIWREARLELQVRDGHIRTIRYNELLSHGRLEDAEEMAEEILRFLGTPFEDDRSLLILHFNHYKLAESVTKPSLNSCQ